MIAISILRTQNPQTTRFLTPECNCQYDNISIIDEAAFVQRVEGEIDEIKNKCSIDTDSCKITCEGASDAEVLAGIMDVEDSGTRTDRLVSLKNY